MNKDLTIIFFEDYFICTILPNENAWEILRVNSVNKQLLYFYVKDNVIRNDEFAKERFEANDKDAFGDFYYSVLEESRTFRKFDLEFHSINLLKDVFEEVKLSYVERIGDFFDGFNNNDEVPVNVCFIPGISEKAQDYIVDFLVQEGFKINSKVDYFEALLSILFRKRIINEKINFSIVESYFGDLLFHYIEYDKKICKRESEKLIGKGVDYRIGNLAKLIVEKAAKRTSSRILFDTALLEQEIKRFHRKAKEEMKNFLHDELDVTIELSDYNKARVIIDMRELDKMSSESFQFIKFKYESFISRYSNLARTEKILLNGEAFSSDNFIQFFEKTYGSNKIIRPIDNFVEILSRGIFSIAPYTNNTSESIEIKITVKAAPPPPPQTPKRGNIETKNNNEDKEKVNVPVPNIPSFKKAAPPPPIPNSKRQPQTTDDSLNGKFKFTLKNLEEGKQYLQRMLEAKRIICVSTGKPFVYVDERDKVNICYKNDKPYFEFTKERSKIGLPIRQSYLMEVLHSNISIVDAPIGLNSEKGIVNSSNKPKAPPPPPPIPRKK